MTQTGLAKRDLAGFDEHLLITEREGGGRE